MVQMFLKCQIQEALSGKVDNCGGVKCHKVTISKYIIDITEFIHPRKKKTPEKSKSFLNA